ncbi:MAG: transferase [Desulfobacteraceae bacterium]|nr:MAG: transferase [Desulfobacteraceae bacterium]
MNALEKLFIRIVQRVNINLRELEFDAKPYVWDLIPKRQMTKFYAFYCISPDHPLNLQFKNTGLAGSYFLGQCRVSNSLLYKCDIRGDELKREGDKFRFKNFTIPISKNEEILIDDSALVKTLIHNYSHDPESPERFFIQDTISTHYANIHGSPTSGCFLGPFATVDLTTVQDCVIGTFSYVQAGEISHLKIDPGTVWVRSPGAFNFLYRYPLEKLKDYIYFEAGQPPKGILMDFVESRKEDFQRVFDVVNIESTFDVPSTASLDRYAVVKPSTRIGENVLVSQRAYIENSYLGKGANAQENCFIINSRLEGNNVTAHGAKIIEATVGENVFVGFNSFLRGQPESRLTIGNVCIIMPHTIIDITEPLAIPQGQIVWGLIKNKKDLETNSISIHELSKINTRFSKGTMFFEGNGSSFVSAFQGRIHHILEANGAYFNPSDNSGLGHAQKNQKMSFNTIQPYPRGENEGLFPTISIQL